MTFKLPGTGDGGSSVAGMKLPSPTPRSFPVAGLEVPSPTPGPTPRQDAPWAFINYNKSIQVWAQEDGSFCVRVIYLGRFEGVAGQTSPGAGGILSGTERGSFEGGYWATVTGTLKSAPGWTTNGLAANTDHQCAISGDCPGAVSWLEQYFEPGYGFTYNWWGWTYHGGKNGSWVNSVDGNSGDILGS